MTQRTEPTTVNATIEVNAPEQRALEVFTRDLGAFKPPEHNLLEVPIAETVVETHLGGHIIDRAHRRKRMPVGARPGLRTP